MPTPALGIPYAPAGLRDGRPVSVCPICHVLAAGHDRYARHYSQMHEGTQPTPEQSTEAFRIADRLLRLDPMLSSANRADRHLATLSRMHQDANVPGPLCELFETALDAWDAFKSALDAEASS